MSAAITSTRVKFEVFNRHLSSSATATYASDPQSHCCSTIASARNEIFRLCSIAGRLCSAFLTAPLDGSSSQNKVGEEIVSLLGEVFIQLCHLSNVCGIDLRLSILTKMELNGRKYPVELCKGKSGKYTKYSHHTGITKTEGQSTVNKDLNNISLESTHSEENNDEADTETIEGITLLLRQFALNRQWNLYHTPRNIALALMGEVGELAELFQWSGDSVDDESKAGAHSENEVRGLMSIGWTSEDVDKVGQEIADVSIYLIRLADVCGVSLGVTSLKLLG